MDSFFPMPLITPTACECDAQALKELPDFGLVDTWILLLESEVSDDRLISVEAEMYSRQLLPYRPRLHHIEKRPGASISTPLLVT